MFGTGKGYGADMQESLKILAAYADAGGNFIDTSDAYRYGESEKIMSSFIDGKRDSFIIASKFGRSADASPVPALNKLGINRKAMILSVEQSLERLKTDRIDIYLAHFDDGITPAEELVRGFEDLVSAGKIIYGGLSNFPAWKMAIAVNTAGLRGNASIIALQTEFSLVQQVPVRELLPMADYFGLGIMAYSPLASGLLTGKYRSNEAGRINLMKKEAQLTDPRNEAIAQQQGEGVVKRCYR